MYFGLGRLPKRALIRRWGEIKCCFTKLERATNLQIVLTDFKHSKLRPRLYPLYNILSVYVLIYGVN